MHPVPCLHLLERTPQGTPACHLGRNFPRDCLGCSAYAPGINEQERERAEVWAVAWMRVLLGDMVAYESGAD